MPQLNSLTLKSFRSYSQRSFTFSKKINIFLGPNACGKTNLLEAIYLLATGKSFKTGKDDEMINFHDDFAHLKAEQKENNLEIVLSRGLWQGKKIIKKKFLLNGVPKSRRNFISKFYVVLFTPEDIAIITGSPSKRRDFLNSVLSPLDWQYQACLNSYQKGLRQRNRLLSLINEGKATVTQLNYWDRLLIKNGQIIAAKRQEFIDFTNSFIQNPVFQNTFPASVIDKLKIYSFSYDSSVISEARLAKYQPAEIASGNTLVGPHRDDLFCFYQQNSDKKDTASYASRGQQRLALLTLKLAHLEFIKQKLNLDPILLLDDIFSELDDQNDQIVLSIIEKLESFITTTNLPSFLHQFTDLEIFNLTK